MEKPAEPVTDDEQDDEQDDAENDDDDTDPLELEPSIVVESEAEARAVNFWLSLPQLHGPGCGCGRCIMTRGLQSVEEMEEVEKLQKTVTVATHKDKPDVLYVGIGLDRKTVQQSLGTGEVLSGWQVLEVAIRLAESGSGKGNGDAYGSDLMDLLRQGFLLGFSEQHSCYLVGKLPDLLSAGAAVPSQTYISRQPDHWLTLGEINLRRESNMTNEKNGKAKGGAAVADKAPKAAKEKGPCACGCGQETGSKFAIGHDSKLRGTIHRVLTGDEKVNIIPRVAFERCGTITVSRFTGTELEDVQVPDCHFDHQRGQKALEDYQEKQEKAKRAEAEKAEKAKSEPVATPSGAEPPSAQ